jgi:hypothetical protein
MRNAYRILIVKLERKRPLERSGSRWKDNIKMDHKAWDMRVWTGLI